MRRPLHMRLGIIVAGTGLVIAGIAGLFLPVVPGWLLIIPGLALLAREFVWAERLLDKAKAKFAEARQAYESRRRSDDRAA